MSFRLKTILGIACIETVLLLMLLLSSLAYLRESNQDELRQRTTTATTLFATATRDAVLSTDLARLEELVQDFLKTPVCCTCASPTATGCWFRGATTRRWPGRS